MTVDQPFQSAALAAEYQLGPELGRGGTGIVYLARDRRDGRFVAIKHIRAKYLGDEEALARVQREARLASSLRHPNIISMTRVLDLGDDGMALVMDYVQGRTLKQRIMEDGPLSFGEAERVLRDIAAALAHAHERGIVHRDVKPENIFLERIDGTAASTPGGWHRARLSDFGIARALHEDNKVTRTGYGVGTPAYMAPESIDGATIDARSDLYSLGMVAWEMISGRTPWQGENIYAVLYHQKHDELRPAFGDLRARAPLRIVTAVEGLQEKDPASRWRDASQFLAALDGAAQRRRFISPPPPYASSDTVRFRRTTTLPQDPVEQFEEEPEPRSRPRVLWGALAAGVLVLATGGLVFAEHQRNSDDVVRNSAAGMLASGKASRPKPPVAVAPKPRPAPPAPTRDMTHPAEMTGTWLHFSRGAQLGDSLALHLREDGTARLVDKRVRVSRDDDWRPTVVIRDGWWRLDWDGESGLDSTTGPARGKLCVRWRTGRLSRSTESCAEAKSPADARFPLEFGGRYWRRVADVKRDDK